MIKWIAITTYILVQSDGTPSIATYVNSYLDTRDECIEIVESMTKGIKKIDKLNDTQIRGDCFRVYLSHD